MEKSVLVIDDEPDVAILLKKGLERQGFRADAFTDPFNALSHFKAGLYDLVVLDFKMHGINGFELYERLAKLDTKLNVLFLSGDSSHYTEYREKFPVLNSSRFLHKPMSIRDFVEQVTRILKDNATTDSV